jgi:hypothetical protein
MCSIRGVGADISGERNLIRCNNIPWVPIPYQVGIGRYVDTSMSDIGAPEYQGFFMNIKACLTKRAVAA